MWVRVLCVRSILLVLATVAGSASLQLPAAPSSDKLDPLLRRQLPLLTGYSNIVVTAGNTSSVESLALLIGQIGGTVRRRLPIIDGIAARVPNAGLSDLASAAIVQHVSLDRPIGGSLQRTNAVIGADEVRWQLGIDGSGIGIAVIDSGVTPSHDDLSDPAIPGSQRVRQFVDFVGGTTTPSDDYGHGTHVAGIIAGNGFDSDGARSGIAPGAHLVVLKVLDGSGQGQISDTIAALDYVLTHRAEANIRIANLSIAAGVYESFNLDPLTIAARRLVESGVIVVAAAGNLGRNASGAVRYGGITAPGNAPWVLTVGASSHMGTIDREDDTVAAFSSRGPTSIDRAPKPDLVAPGVGTESLAAPESTLYGTRAPYLLAGTVPTGYSPYLSLSGTSMSAPVVSGTIALMLQENPELTPNAVKAILQYSAESKAGYDVMTQGAGFLNAAGAVELARFFASPLTRAYPIGITWSRQVIWGARAVRGGELDPTTPAWNPAVLWGAVTTPAQMLMAWTYNISPTGVGTTGSSDDESLVWGTTGDDDSLVWGTTDDDGLVWGTGCNDPSCDVRWEPQ